MADIFSDGVDAGTELSQSVDAGSSAAPVQGDAPDAFADESGTESSTAAAGTQEPADPATTAADQGAQVVPDGTQQQQAAPDGSKELSEEDLAKIEQEAEAALSDERSPKFFTNALRNVYKPKIDKLTAQVEKYSAFGEPEQIGEKLGLVDKLGEVRTDPQTRMPVKDTSGFAQAVYEKDPDVALNLIGSLSQLPDPEHPERNLVQSLLNTIGIDHNRLPDIQRFAQNGYQLQAAQFAPPDPQDLALIPPHLQATFAKLSPEVRDSLMGDNDAVRVQNLESHRYRFEAEEGKQAQDQQDATQRQQTELKKQQDFAEAVDAKADEYFEKSGESVLNSFVDSLAKGAGMSPLDSLMISNAVLNSFEPTLAGRRTAEALKAEGIEIDPAIAPAIAKLQELSRHAAYYEEVGDKTSLQNVAADIAEIQERIAAKGNKLIAALAKKRNGTVTQPGRDQQTALAATVNDRHAFNGTPREGGPATGARTPVMDFSDEAYREELRNSGFR
jgi:hypothetical protein